MGSGRQGAQGLPKETDLQQTSICNATRVLTQGYTKNSRHSDEGATDFSERLWKDARIEMVSLGGWVARGVRRSRISGARTSWGRKGHSTWEQEDRPLRLGSTGFLEEGVRRRLEGAAGRGCKSLETHSHSHRHSL